MPRFRKASNIRAGVIGYGGAYDVGHAHITWIRTTGMTPVCVVDTDPNRLEIAAREFPEIERYSSVTEMLKKSDVHLLTVGTPHNTHAPLAVQCLRAGRHVITEKPFAVTTTECDRMIDEARKRRLVITTHHNRHWDSSILIARQVIEKGAIGQIIGIEAHIASHAKPRDWWRSSKSASGGALYDWGVHVLEWALQLIDSKIVEVSGFATRGTWAPPSGWRNDLIEDEGRVVVRFKSGQWLSMCVSSIDTAPQREGFIIRGTQGTHLLGPATTICKKGNAMVATNHRLPPRRWEMSYKNLVDHLTRGVPLIITPQWARRPVHILDLAYRSARLGRSLKAKYG